MLNQLPGASHSQHRDPRSDLFHVTEADPVEVERAVTLAADAFLKLYSVEERQSLRRRVPERRGRAKTRRMDKPTSLPSPPIAEQRPYSYERHGVTMDDPWHWLRDPKYPEVDDPDVLAYLKAENAYFEGWKAQHQGLIDQLFEEMKGRIKEDESSVPIRDGEYLYWWAFKPGAQYRSWYRKPVAGGDDQTIFDEPAEAEGREYFRLGALEVSPDGRLLATLADYDGSERFELRIRDLAT